MDDDIIQQSLAVLDACIGVYGPDATRLLPGRVFVQMDLRQKIGSYLKDENYVSINRKGATILPQYKNLAGLKAFLETKHQTKRTVPVLKLGTSFKKQENTNVSVTGKRPIGRLLKKKRQAYSSAYQRTEQTSTRPSTKLTSVSGILSGNNTVYTSDTEHESSLPFTLIKQNYGPVSSVNVDDRYYMGVVRLFGLNLPIPVGTIVWPVEIKMELEPNEDNNNDQYGEESSLYKSESNSNPSSSKFESAEEEFSEDLNAPLEDEEPLSYGSM